MLFLSFLSLYLFSEAASSHYRNSHYYNNLDNHIADYLDIEDLGNYNNDEIEKEECIEESTINKEFFQVNSIEIDHNEVPNYLSNKLNPQLRVKSSILNNNENIEEKSYGKIDDDDDNSSNENLIRKLNEYKIDSNLNFSLNLNSTIFYTTLALVSIGVIVLFL